MMTFMVNDLLDYAHLKSGKFRKNITLFNIREALWKVVSIVQQKANDLKISLNLEFLNISEENENNSQSFSPFICTDEGRVK